MWRVLGLVLLAIAMAGFGTCAVTSGVFALRAPWLWVLTVPMVVLTWLCWRGIRHLRRRPPPAAE
jgi:endonuclease/exonuclease/phosphatase (EEP) superfamily protein YafD